MALLGAGAVTDFACLKRENKGLRFVRNLRVLTSINYSATLLKMLRFQASFVTHCIQKFN
jgi:hypothetical protein